MRRGLLVAAVLLPFLGSCQQQAVQTPTPPPSGKSASLRIMEQVAIAAHRCWLASKDPAFTRYRMANELNSFSGQPRFLLVPARDYGARPLLVVQARGQSSRVEVFGPLLAEPLGSRIEADLDRWRQGDDRCAAAG